MAGVLNPPDTAFVLGGGGVLGSVQVGMLTALRDAGIRPDLVLGTSVGAVNGALLASAPEDGAERLAQLWASAGVRATFGGGPLRRLREVARTGVAAHSAAPLRELLRANLGTARIEDLTVPFECCAASIEDAAEHWFTTGSVVDAVLASSAVPGLLPPVRIGDRHYLDGGLVHSIPLGRAVEHGARRIFVLQVGRVEQPLRPPRRPWEVGLVAFEIARRHRFFREIAAAPADVEVHVLPAGEGAAPAWNSRAALRYRDPGGVAQRVAVAREATAAYLDRLR